MSIHQVVQGETLARIAAAYGFRDYRALYEHERNAELRRKRPNPDIIFPGDEVYVPDIATRTVSIATGRCHRFVVSSPRKALHLVVQDGNGAPLRKAPYELELEAELFTGETNERGRLEQRVPIEARHATLRVRRHVWKLKIGDLNPIDDTSDDGISGIQMRLRNLGFDPGPIDGIIGRRTKQAIRSFQKKHPPLEVDGICGPQTQARLLREHGC